MRRFPTSLLWISAWLCCALARGTALSAEPAPAHSAIDPTCDSAPLVYVGAPSGCCNLCPCSYAWAEGLILTRDNRSDNQPLALDLNDDDVLLSGGDLDFDWTGGFRVGYGKRICGCWGAEVAYFGVFDNSASAGVELEDSLMLPGTLGQQVNNFFAADEVDIRYSSDLHSFEANLVRCCCNQNCCGGRSVELLGGFRFVALDEEIGISSFDSEESTTRYRVEADNRLYGAQLGGRIRNCHGRFSWEATGKAGIFGNNMTQRQPPIVDFSDLERRSRRESDDTDVAFVDDLNFSGIYHLNRVWGLRAGYNLIWIEGVALAADQLDFTNTDDSGTALFADSGVFLHGVNVGVEARW